MKFCNELPVASLLIYPAIRSEASDTAHRFVRYRIKQAKAGDIEATIRRLIEILPGSPLEPLFAELTTLVPVPGHAPLTGGGLWVAESICKAMAAAGLGRSVATCLRRERAVPRSSGISAGEDRPAPGVHCDSLSLLPDITIGDRVLLVDDVVTRGSTLIGAATKLQERWPALEVGAFALVRVEQVELGNAREMLAPKMERIKFDQASGKLIRE